MSPLLCAAAADPSEADGGALRQALALVRQERRVGGDDDDDGAAAGLGSRSAGAFLVPRRRHRAQRDLPADRHAVDREQLTSAVVRLHEDADGPAAR